jgi:hypothetical protein
MFESKIKYERKNETLSFVELNGLGTFLFAFFFTTFAFFCKKRNMSNTECLFLSNETYLQRWHLGIVDIH